MNGKYLVKEEPILTECGARLGTHRSYHIPTCDKENCKHIELHTKKEMARYCNLLKESIVGYSGEITKELAIASIDMLLNKLEEEGQEK